MFVILEGGGPHHFAQFKDHATNRQPESLFTTVSDYWSWPQAWTNHYVNATKALMRFHSGYPPNVCVLWKAMHVGPRSRNNLGYHHPSVVNGPNHMLNRLAISAAQDVGMPVIDLTELTSKKQPTTKEDGAHRSMAPDGDPYHDGTTGIRIRSLGRRPGARAANVCEVLRHRSQYLRPEPL